MRPLGDSKITYNYLTTTEEVGNAEAVGDIACDPLCLTSWKTGAD